MMTCLTRSGCHLFSDCVFSHPAHPDLPLLLFPWVTDADCFSPRCLLATSITFCVSFSIMSNLPSCFKIATCMPFSPCCHSLLPFILQILPFSYKLCNSCIFFFSLLSAPLESKPHEDRKLCLFCSVTYFKYLAYVQHLLMFFSLKGT